MPEKMSKELMITTGLCDRSAVLGIANSFELCMDIATEHAYHIGNGLSYMRERGLFWLAVRTRIRFFRRPAIEEIVTLSSWPERPRRLRCNRSYRLEKAGETLFVGRTEWAVLDTAEGTLVNGDAVYSPTMQFSEPPAIDEPFARVRDNFDSIDDFGTYTIRSTDIDLGGHMNNAAYIRALMGAFRSEDRFASAIQLLDVRYVSPSYEGEVLGFQQRTIDGGLELRAHVGERTVLLIYAQEAQV